MERHDKSQISEKIASWITFADWKTCAPSPMPRKPLPSKPAPKDFEQTARDRPEFKGKSPEGAANLDMREVLLGRGHLPVRDRRAYNIALEPADGSAILT